VTEILMYPKLGVKRNRSETREHFAMQNKIILLFRIMNIKLAPRTRNRRAKVSRNL